MSSRADFYVGRGPSSTWVGSIGHDAFAHELEAYFREVLTPEQFRTALAKVFADYGEISAEDGWPWPWSSSKETGTAVAFDNGQVWISLHGRNWAPIQAWDIPGPVPSVFADMVAVDEATPEGRLRLALRQGSRIRLKPDAPVLPPLMARLGYLLARSWMHSHEEGEQVRMLMPAAPVQDEVFDLVLVLRAHAGTVHALVEAQQAVDGELVWDLATWASENLRPYYARNTVHVALTDTLPVYFGHPIFRPCRANVRLPASLHLHVEPRDSGYLRGRALLEQALDLFPSLYAYALAHEMLAHGILPGGAESLEAWLDERPPEFGGASWRSVGNSAQGRRLASLTASRYLWTA